MQFFVSLSNDKRILYTTPLQMIRDEISINPVFFNQIQPFDIRFSTWFLTVFCNFRKNLYELQKCFMYPMKELKSEYLDYQDKGCGCP